MLTSEQPNRNLFQQQTEQLQIELQSKEQQLEKISEEPSKTKADKALEWAQVIIDEYNKISIQHLLQVGNPAKPYIVKHWRQDWIYQNQNFWFV